jgi:replicative DNA helicase
MDESEQIVYDVGNRDQRGSFSSVSSLLLDTFYKLETRHAQSGERTGITSGFGDIDAYTAGFQRGNFIILAARPAMGKTSLALNMALFAAREERQPVAIFSLEMTKQELIERLISSEAMIDASKLRRGAIEQKEWQRIGDAIGKLNDLPIYLDDSGAVTVTEIRSRLRRLKSTHGLSIAYIDYLQLVRPSTLNSRGSNRNEELSDICRMLKATAKDLEIPIVALAQLNRAVETRQDKRPMLSDLRDSGSIEQEADIVTFLYRDAYYNKEASAEPDATEFIFAKHRNGKVGTVKLRFRAEHTLFQPYGDDSHYPAP